MYISRKLYSLLLTYITYYRPSHTRFLHTMQLTKLFSDLCSFNRLYPDINTFKVKSKVKVKFKIFYSNKTTVIVCINQKHQHSLVQKRLHKRENPAKNGQPRYK